MNTRTDPGSDILHIIADPVSTWFVLYLELLFSSTGRGVTYVTLYSRCCLGHNGPCWKDIKSKECIPSILSPHLPKCYWLHTFVICRFGHQTCWSPAFQKCSGQRQFFELKYDDIYIIQWLSYIVIWKCNSKTDDEWKNRLNSIKCRTFESVISWSFESVISWSSNSSKR